MTSEIININDWLSLHARNYYEIIRESKYLFSYDKEIYTKKPFIPVEVVKLNCEVSSEEE